MTHLSAEPPPIIRRRLLIHVPGYEPLSAEAHRRRLLRTLDCSAAAWDAPEFMAVIRRLTARGAAETTRGT